MNRASKSITGFQVIVVVLDRQIQTRCDKGVELHKRLNEISQMQVLYNSFSS